MTSDGNNPNIAAKNTRRDARELALRMLYELDLGGQSIDVVIEAALPTSQLTGATRQFAIDLVSGCHAHMREIDAALSAHTDDWGLGHSAVDRNILRLAAYELQYCPDSPVAVVCNEAVELAKKYSSPESTPFINGVLGGIVRLPRGTEAEPTAVVETCSPPETVSQAGAPSVPREPARDHATDE